jgi:hypothetical protein
LSRLVTLSISHFFLLSKNKDMKYYKFWLARIVQESIKINYYY